MSVIIHPTAIVAPGAELDENVEIGPYSIIGENVKITRGTKVGPHVLIEGWTQIGGNCQIFQGVVIGTSAQDVSSQRKRSYVQIGHDNLIREYATIHRGTKEESTTYIGNSTFLMAYTHIAHNCRVGDEVVMANCASLAGYVTLEKNAVIGGLTAIHQFVRIGAYAIIGGCSKIVQDIPPYIKATGHPGTLWGLNTVGLRRAGFSLSRRNLLKKAYRILFRSHLNTSQALEEIEKELDLSPEIEHLCKFIRTSQRGICKERKKVV